jgi:hypothetical protein
LFANHRTVLSWLRWTHRSSRIHVARERRRATGTDRADDLVGTQASAGTESHRLTRQRHGESL